MNTRDDLTGSGADTAHLTQFTGTAEHLLGLLSRSRPRASTAGNTIESQMIRLSQLRVEGGPTVAVLKVARNPRGATELRTQRRLVAEIASQPGLDKTWRELVPRVLAFDERRDATICVESYRPGIPLSDVLADYPDRFEELTAWALSAIAPLHRATARSIVADNLSYVRQWVVDPVTDLAQFCGRLDPGLMPGLERVEAILTRAMVGRRMTVCWTHGDYTPGSVRLAGRQGPVNRIVAWDKARGDRPALIDVYLMLLSASGQVDEADLGAVVSRRLRAGGLSDSERNVLKAVGTGAGDSEHVDERVAILLAWLQHTAELCRTDADRPKRDAWLAANVAPVLDAVAEWRGYYAASGPSATQVVLP
jgi:hypothetical protein